MDSFSDYINNFNKNTKHLINTLIKNKKTCYNNFILITDIADERISEYKKSYLDLQIFLKPMNIKDANFSYIAKNIYDNYVIDILDYIKNEFNDNFECYKTKK